MHAGQMNSLLSRLLAWWREPEAPGEKTERDSPPESKVVDLPAEAYVFECQACGKVFEARRRRPLCPECDSPDVTLMSE